MAGFKNIVACTDFSDNSNKAVAMAKSLSDGGKVTVLHVVGASYSYDPLGMAEASASTTAKSYGEKAEAQIRELYGDDVDVAIEYGNAAAKIIAFAQEKGADLVVIGTRGVGLLAGLLGGGSVATKVVSNSPVPVLAVPA